MRSPALGTLSGPMLRRAVRDSFVKLDPRVQWKNPVMFVVLVGSALVTLLWIVGSGTESRTFVFAVALWLWFTLLFANLAESMAEGRGKAQAAALRGTRRDVLATQLGSLLALALGERLGAAAEERFHLEQLGQPRDGRLDRRRQDRGTPSDVRAISKRALAPFLFGDSSADRSEENHGQLAHQCLGTHLRLCPLRQRGTGRS